MNRDKHSDRGPEGLTNENLNIVIPVWAVQRTRALSPTYPFFILSVSDS